MIKNTLVAIDGSPCAESARRYAVALCLKLRSQLELVHVVDSRLFLLPALETGPAAALSAYPAQTSRDLQQILTRRGELCLSDAATRSEAEGLSVATTLLVGPPAQHLVDLQARTELVVLGRNGEHAMPSDPASAVSTGSVTDRVVRRACRPCLVVPPSAPPPARILVALDGSPASFRAAHVAFELANALASPLVLLAVAERPDRLEDAQMLAAEAHRLARAHECAAATYVAEGAPAPKILETAQKTGSTLLVAGSHGHGWIYDRIIGNTAAHLLANSPLPLLLVR
jgi:nucleotide-binding universal stress UspA family protein